MDSILDSSTEELSSEDRLMLSSSKRQEPQGEEEHDTFPNKSEPQVASKSVLQERPSSSSSSTSSSTSNSICGDREPEPETFFYGKSKSNNMSLDSNAHSAYNTLIIHHNNSSLLADTWIPASHEFTSVGMGNNRNSNNPRSSTSPTKDSTGCLVQRSNSPKNSHFKNSPPSFENNSSNTTVTSSELSDIPRDYLDQLTVLKHLAKEVQQDPVSGPSQSLLRSASFSKSQPDLTQASLLTNSPASHDPASKPKKKKHPHSSGSSNVKQLSPPSSSNSHLSNEEVLPSVQILEILMRENSNLKAELVNARRRINIINKLETELSRLQASHAALFESTERRESLERTARTKLSTEVKRLTAVNRELLSSSNSLQNLSPYAVNGDIETVQKDLSKKELKISQLVSQNKELSATKERQEIELAAQRATLAEQRNHIDILDTALTNAQSNVLRLEEELRKKQEYVDKVSQLQRAISSLQLSSEKREQSEKKLRTQLEAEVTDLKLQLASSNANSNTHHHGQPMHHSTPSMSSNMRGYHQQQQVSSQPPPYPGLQHNSGNGSQSSIHIQTQQEIQNLQEKLKLSEEKILSLDAQVARWEHFFASPGNEKPTLVSGGGNASSPNTPNSWSSRGGTPHFFGSGSSTGMPDDLMQTKSRTTDLEWKIKDLESRLNERDAMIRVLHLQNVPGNSNGGFSDLRTQNVNNSSGTSPLFSSFNSSSSSSVAAMALPSYRESPNYSSANGKNHQVSVSLASINQNPVNIIDPVLMYSKMSKCDSEPPSYANLPLRLRGSGSSLVKNSNESLQSTNGNIMGNSGHGSSSGSQEEGKSIDEQLKELDKQLLSKGGPTGLKMQSGLCCIPGFSHPSQVRPGRDTSSTPTRKGKLSQSLLESLNHQNTRQNSNNQEPSNNNCGNVNNNNNTTALHNKKSFKPVLPLPPLPLPKTQVPHFQQMQYPNHSSLQGGQQTIRTSSGPPFIPGSTSSSMNPPVNHNATALSLSNSVDSILSDEILHKKIIMNTPRMLRTGLPPKSPVEVSGTATNKCRSLERNKPTTTITTSELAAGKYTNYDLRCKSLDRRELKAQSKAEEKQEKKLHKSSVSSKAAFFGQLLTRRSPSPSRSKEKDKALADSSGSQSQVVQPKVVRFPFGSGKNPDCEHDLDAAFLDKQGRSSQRSRVSKWTMSSIQELESAASPWIQRRSAEVLDSSQSNQTTELARNNVGSKNMVNASAPVDSKKWGKIVKTPFGLRYTFGSPKSSDSNSGGKMKEGNNFAKDGMF